MSPGGLFVLCWVLGVIISAVFVAMNPVRADLGPKTQRMRRSAIIAGFVPCSFLATAIQIFYIIAYRASISMSSAGQAKLNASLSTDFGVPQRTQMPPDSAGTARPPAGDNPFL